jgi:hypothetical protein
MDAPSLSLAPGPSGRVALPQGREEYYISTSETSKFNFRHGFVTVKSDAAVILSLVVRHYLLCTYLKHPHFQTLPSLQTTLDKVLQVGLGGRKPTTKRFAGFPCGTELGTCFCTSFDIAYETLPRFKQIQLASRTRAFPWPPLLRRLESKASSRSQGPPFP